MLEQNAVLVIVDKSYLEPLQYLPTAIEPSSAKPDSRDLKRTLGNQEIVSELNSGS